MADAEGAPAGGMVCEDPVLLLCGVVESCQRKEGPLAGVEPVEVLDALMPEHLLLFLVSSQHFGLGSALLKSRHDQLVHQMMQLQMLPALLSKKLHGTHML
ncbi:MAG: hypothetical protein FRX49_10372 [Trebouxia sp. A1-2]|nr:MAG: hypothetical protein FRX49_10372 [Trebouxia sp. A1-2]